MSWYGAVAWRRTASDDWPPPAVAYPAIASSGRTARQTMISAFLIVPTPSHDDRGRVGPDDHRVADLDDLVDGETGGRGVPPDRLRARRLVDADGADGSVALRGDVAADPADVVRHALAFGGRAPRRLA